MSWTPKLIINLGYSPDAGNLAFTLFNFGGVLGIFILGYLASKWSLSTLISIFAITSAVFMWAFAGAVFLEFNQTNLMLLIFIIGISMQGGYTGIFS